MIKTMKKYSFLVFHSDYHDFLVSLGKLGIVHVIERTRGSREETLKEKKELLERIDKTIDFLRKIEKTDPGTADVVQTNESAEELLSEIRSINKLKTGIEEHIVELQKEIKYTLPWGEYNRNDLDKLRASGFKVRLYHCSLKKFDPEWEEKYSLFRINTLGGKVYFAVILNIDESIDIDAVREKPVRNPLSELEAELNGQQKLLEETEARLAGIARNSIPLLEKKKEQIEADIMLSTVYLETGKASEDRLRILEGWVPEDATVELNKLLEKKNIVSLVTPPGEGEVPPVQLKNSKFSMLFEPISKLFSLPAYNELDLTPYFAPFFMLFFGFCLGDAGYGVFFILFAMLLKRKAKKEWKPFLTLAQYFGAATILFGLLSGTFFGINLIDSGYTLTTESIEKLEKSGIPPTIMSGLMEMEGTYYKGRAEFLEAAKSRVGEEALADYQKELLKKAESGIPLIGSFRYLMQDSLSMFYLSMLIGGLQILFGIFLKIRNITRRRGFKYARSTLGWLILMISLVLYYTGLFGSEVLTWVFYGLLAISGILIFILNNPDSNIFARIGSGIWDSYGMVTGVFGDLLSYIRLFALGISSAILGFVFNDISLQLLNIPYVGWLFFLILLLFGHSINLFLATLGGFIHPMRLTFVEFYKNAGFEGGGKEYKPFIIKNQ